MVTYVVIYALLCPFTGEPRYVGKTKRRLDKRYREHICTYGTDVNTFCGKWINELKLHKLLPDVKVLEECDKTIWQQRERYWIAKYRKIYDLLNMDGGGITSKHVAGGYDDYYKSTSQSYKKRVDEIIHGVRLHINRIQVKELNIVPNENQKLAIRYILNWINNGNNPIELVDDPRVRVDFDNKLFMTLSGSAGTGKTTLLKLILQEANARRVMITAPTHKAKKVAERMTGLQGETIQKLLGLRPNTDIDNFDIDNVLFELLGNSKMGDAELIVLDEGSMANKDLNKHIRNEATKANTKILFIGDKLQLPPVNEHISEVFNNSNYVELTEIMRQSHTNPLNELLYRLRNDIEDYKLNTFSEYIGKNPKAHNEEGEGYEMVRDQATFNSRIKDVFGSDEYKTKTDMIKFCAYENDVINKYNHYIRDIVFNGKQEELLRVDDIMTGYRTIKQGDNAVVTNSEDYRIISCAKNLNFYDIPCYEIKMESLDTGIRTPIIFVTRRDGYTQFHELHNRYHKAALNHKAWKAYYDFKDQTMTMEKLKTESNKDIPKEIDYGYGITIHKTQGSTYETVLVDGANVKKVHQYTQWKFQKMKTDEFAEWREMFKKQKGEDISNRTIAGEIQGRIEVRKLLYVALSRASKNIIIKA